MPITLKKTREFIYNMAVVIYIMVLIFQSSMYMFNHSIYIVLEYIKKITILLLVVKIFMDIIEPGNKFNLKNIFITFVLTIIIFLSLIKTDDIATTLFLLIVLIAFNNTNFERVIKNIFFIELFSFIFILLSCKMGIIEDFTIRRELGEEYRHSLGFIHPNTLMLSFFSIVILYLYWQKDKINLIKTLMLFVFSLVIFYYTDSRMGLVAVILALIINYIFKFKGKIILAKYGNILSWSIVIFAVLSVIMTILYPKINMSKLNELLSNRILLQYRALDRYGITLFGQEIEWVGQGASNEELDWNKYNFIDNSYIKALVNNGILFFMLIILGHYYILKEQIVKNRNVYAFVAVFMIGIYSITDVALLRIMYNPFIILMAPMFNIFSSNKKENYSAVGKENKNEKEYIKELHI